MSTKRGGSSELDFDDFHDSIFVLFNFVVDSNQHLENAGESKT